MEQSLTLEQVNELSFKEREKLFDWFRHKMNPAVALAAHSERSNVKIVLTQLTIGDLFEFLREYNTMPMVEDDGSSWAVTCVSGISSIKDELIDALWEVTKLILKEETEVKN